MGGSRRHLANPPIREAIIEFVFETSVPEDVLRLYAENFVAKKSDWTKKDAKLITAKLQLGTEESFERSEAFHGIRITSPDSSSIVIFRPDRVTVSRVNSYTTWEDLEASAFEAAECFVEGSRSEALLRISTRFINVIGSDDANPLASLRNVPASLLTDAILTDFVDRQVLVDKNGHRVNVTLATGLEPGGGIGQGSKGIVLDIDVVKEISVNLSEASSILSALRETKNEIFFGAIKIEALQ